MITVTDEMVEAARFLLDRLNEFSSDFVDDAASDWLGHVAPAMSRLEAAIQAAPAAEPVGTVVKMPGSTGFTMAVFGAEQVPVGTSLYTAPPAPVTQCCMCGKTGLSTVEGDGGSECQLSDGRWTCSFECWERATERDAPPAPVADGWRPDAEKMREDCARWCETNGFAEAAPMLRKLPISRSRAASTEAGR